MKKIYAIFILFFVLCACATGQKKNEIVVCGDDKVWIVNVDNSEGKNLDIVWKWNAQESNIPDDFKKYFHSKYLQPIITQYFIDNKSEIWLLFLIAHSKR